MNYAIKDACNVILTERASNKPVLYTDYLNTFSVSLSGESVFAKAKGMNKIAFSGSKTGTCTMEAEVYEFKFLALMLGGNMTTGASQIAKRDVVKLDLTTGKALLLNTAVEGSISVFELDRDGRTHLSELADATTSVSGEVTEVTSVLGKGKSVAVYYLVEVPTAKKIVVTEKSDGKVYRIEGITAMKNEFGEDELFAIKINNAKPQENMELSLNAENVASISAVFDILSDENGHLMTLTLIEDDEMVESFGIGSGTVGESLAVG